MARAVGRGWMRSSAGREDGRVHLMKAEQLRTQHQHPPRLVPPWVPRPYNHSDSGFYREHTVPTASTPAPAADHRLDCGCRWFVCLDAVRCRRWRRAQAFSRVA